MKRNQSQNVMLLAGMGIGLWLVSRLRTRMNFKGKVVVITGGSRGLGLTIARQFAAEGAKIALLARFEEELSRALSDLDDQEATTLAVQCNITDRVQVESAIQQVHRTFGRIDVLINNAGIIQVGPLEHMTDEDFAMAMGVHFWGPLYAMQAVAPIMRNQGGGRIVNIGSIGGLVAVPHLAPYIASKHALVGLSDAFRTELAKDNIRVSTVNPGLMRTGSHYHAFFKGQYEKEFTWFSLSNAIPLFSTSSHKAARQVIDTVRWGRPGRTLTIQASLLSLFSGIFSNVYARLSRFSNRLLPAPAGPEGDQPRTGFESQSTLSPSVLTRMADKAAERNNEIPPVWAEEIEDF